MLVGNQALKDAWHPARRRTYVILLLTALAVVGLDHLTKWLVVQHLPLGGAIGADAPVSIHHVENRGAAFGFGPQFQWLYLIVAAVVSIYILAAGHRFGSGWFRLMLLGGILGGALSNGGDRLVQGYVVDFVDLHWWPVFNVADSAIVLGVIGVVVLFRPHAAHAAS